MRKTRLGLVACLLTICIHARASGQSPATAPTSKPHEVAALPTWFTPPAGWTMRLRGQLVFLDAPQPASSNEKRSATMAIAPPIKYAGRSRDMSLKQFLALVQKPDPVLQRTEVLAGKNHHGQETLTQSLVVESSPGHKLWRTYAVARDGEWAILILFTADSQAANDELAKELGDFISKLDASKAPREASGQD